MHCISSAFLGSFVSAITTSCFWQPHGCDTHNMDLIAAGWSVFKRWAAPISYSCWRKRTSILNNKQTIHSSSPVRETSALLKWHSIHLFRGHRCHSNSQKWALGAVHVEWVTAIQKCQNQSLSWDSKAVLRGSVVVTPMLKARATSEIKYNIRSHGRWWFGFWVFLGPVNHDSFSTMGSIYNNDVTITVSFLQKVIKMGRKCSKEWAKFC